MKTNICIIGAGLAGLTAAKILYEHNIDICILDANDTIGGRIQTDNINGYLCDRGFQVLLPAYPTAKKYLNYKQLQLKGYPRGAISITDKIEWFGAPFFYPQQWQYGTKLKPKFNDWLLFASEMFKSGYPNLNKNDISTNKYFNQRYSQAFNKKFLTPFFQGVFLDQSCNASSQLFRYYWRLFAQQGAAIPAEGMGEIPKQLARSIPAEAIKCSHKVTKLNDQQIILENGSTIQANKIIIACDQQNISKLIPTISSPNKPLPISTYFFTTSKLKQLGPLNFILNSTPQLQISIPTLIQPSYSKNNDHLIMISCIGGHKQNPDEIIKQLKNQIGDQVNYWDFIHYHHIEYALPTNKSYTTLDETYYYCGDWESFGSIESAMRSGQNIAHRVLQIL